MNDSLPSPPVPADCDVRDLKWMPLDVVRLRDSDTASHPDAEVFRISVLSWCASWHQVPAGSLPDDDQALARLLGYGRDLRGWRRIRATGALRGWVKCSDGRLYHPVVAEKAIEALAQKQKSQRKREHDAERLRRWREKQAETSDEARNETRFVLGLPDQPTNQQTNKQTNHTAPPSPSSLGEVTATRGDGVNALPGEEKPGRPPSRKAKAMDEVALRLAVNSGDLLGILTVFRVEDPKDAGWYRETDGMDFREIVAVLAWRKVDHKDLPRWPSGFRAARATWYELKLETRKHLAALRLGELGIEHGIKVEVPV